MNEKLYTVTIQGGRLIRAAALAEAFLATYGTGIAECHVQLINWAGIPFIATEIEFNPKAGLQPEIARQLFDELLGRTHYHKAFVTKELRGKLLFKSPSSRAVYPAYAPLLRVDDFRYPATLISLQNFYEAVVCKQNLSS